MDKAKTLLRATLALGLLILFCGTAQATVYEYETFDSGWTPGASWTADRYMPSTVESADFDGDSRLHYFLSASDQQTNSFYNYQGVSHSVAMPSASVQSFSVDLYVADGWTSTTKNVGIWGVGNAADGSRSAYPIVAYRSDGTTDGFYTWDYIAGGWTLGLALDSSDYDAWHTLSFTLTKGVGMEFFADGTSLGLFADIDTVDLSAVILNAYNTGVDCDYYFDNFIAKATPIPGAVWLLGTGLLGLLGFRKKHRS